MAYTITQAPAPLAGAKDPVFVVVKDTVNTAEERYRYVCQISVDGSVIGTFKQLPNNANCGAFSLNEIFMSYVEQEENPWRLGKYLTNNDLDTAKLFSTNAKAIQTFNLNFGYEFSIISGDAPTQVLNAATDSIKVTNATYRQFALSSASNLVSNYAISTSSSKLLSDVPLTNGVYQQWVGEEQFGALAFLNGDDVGSVGSGYLVITFYDNAGTSLSSGIIENSVTNGGEPPAASLTDSQSLLYFGCFPANLEAQTLDATIKPSAQPTWDYYEIYLSRDSAGVSQDSKIYRFNRADCERFTPHYTLAWWNSVGGVDQLIFSGLNKVTQDIKRTTYRTRGGNAYDADGTTNPYIDQSYQGGLKSLNPLTSTVLELTTIEQSPEHLQPLISSLMTSERVYAYGTEFGNISSTNPGYVRVVVKDNTLTKKVGRHDGYVSYSVKVEVSRYIP
tara:strand:- start:14543 stop:15886 length:1344 start_codon:yes stop_codon:yes gene_type:complete